MELKVISIFLKFRQADLRSLVLGESLPSRSVLNGIRAREQRTELGGQLVRWIRGGFHIDSAPSHWESSARNCLKTVFWSVIQYVIKLVQQSRFGGDNCLTTADDCDDV